MEKLFSDAPSMRGVDSARGLRQLRGAAAVVAFALWPAQRAAKLRRANACATGTYVSLSICPEDKIFNTVTSREQSLHLVLRERWRQ